MPTYEVGGGQYGVGLAYMQDQARRQALLQQAAMERMRVLQVAAQQKAEMEFAREKLAADVQQAAEARRQQLQLAAEARMDAAARNDADNAGAWERMQAEQGWRSGESELDRRHREALVISKRESDVQDEQRKAQLVEAEERVKRLAQAVQMGGGPDAERALVDAETRFNALRGTQAPVEQAAPSYVSSGAEARRRVLGPLAFEGMAAPRPNFAQVGAQPEGTTPLLKVAQLGRAEVLRKQRDEEAEEDTRRRERAWTQHSPRLVSVDSELARLAEEPLVPQDLRQTLQGHRASIAAMLDAIRAGETPPVMPATIKADMARAKQAIAVEGTARKEREENPYAKQAYLLRARLQLLAPEERKPFVEGLASWAALPESVLAQKRAAIPPPNQEDFKPDPLALDPEKDKQSKQLAYNKALDSYQDAVRRALKDVRDELGGLTVPEYRSIVLSIAKDVPDVFPQAIQAQIDSVRDATARQYLQGKAREAAERITKGRRALTPEEAQRVLSDPWWRAAYEAATK